MRKTRKKFSITVAVVAYFGAELLQKTIDSILVSAGKQPISLLVIPNGIILDKNTKEFLKERNIPIIFNKVEKGLTARIKQAISLTDDDLLVLTQDGIGFTLHTLEQIQETFRNHPDATLTSPRIVPSHAQNMHELITDVRANLKWRVGNSWRRKDNYLMVSSRCLALKTEFAKQMTIPDKVNNIATYLYLENKRLKGRFRYTFNAICTNNRPQNLNAYIDWRRGLESTQAEMLSYFEDRARDFKIPKFIVFESTFLEIVNHPVPTILYFGLLSYIKSKQYILMVQSMFTRVFGSISMRTKTAADSLSTKSARALTIPPKKRVRLRSN